ncbi:peptide deformylase [Cryptosporangium japonicum]
MRQLGIAQLGEEPMLRSTARPFVLPAEAGEARAVVRALHERLVAIRKVHTFTKGTGLAAPQIRIDRRATVVIDPDGQRIELVNPWVVDESPEVDEPKYEGCLSFFDARGRLARPLRITVEHQGYDGSPRVSVFTESVARLVMHEIDHLDGTLYADRMDVTEKLIAASDYRGTGHRWDYGSSGG